MYWNDIAWEPYADIEQGGIALQDNSQGLEVQTWKAWLDQDGWLNIRSLPDGAPIQLENVGCCHENIALAFNQNMDWQIAWEDGTDIKMRWWDTLINDYATWIEPNAYGPALTLDDHRNFNSPLSDVLFFYCKGTNLYYRQQRERYNTERLLGALPANTLALGRCGMNAGLRVQIEVIKEDTGE